MSRIVSTFLVMLTLIGMVSCARNADADEALATSLNYDSNVDTGSDSVTETKGSEPDLPEVNYSGRRITFLEREIENGNNINVFFNEIYAEINGETINDAIYERNTAVTNKYGIEIVSVRKFNDTISTTFTNSVKAGEKIYDVLHANGTTTMSLAVNGYLTDMNDLPYVNYNNPWWMGMVMETSSISGNNAFAIGDTNIQSFTAVSAVYFNKELVKNLNLDDPYKVVKDGKWIIDKMYTYCAAAVSDLNGDGLMNVNDRYGIIFNAYAWAPFFYGSGLCIIQKDANDLPYLNLNDEKVYNTLSKVVDFLADTQVQECSSWVTIDDMAGKFQNGNSMFYVQLMYTVMTMRGGELDFGILPIPKASEEQDGYFSYIHNKSSYTSIPKTNTDLAMTGILLEDMAYHSYKVVRPAFFEIMLDGKVAKDQESTEMLDIVYSNMYVCLLQPMSGVGLSTDTTMRSFIVNKTGSASITSTLKMTEKVWTKTLGEIAESFAKNMGS